MKKLDPSEAFKAAAKAKTQAHSHFMSAARKLTTAQLALREHCSRAHIDLADLAAAAAADAYIELERASKNLAIAKTRLANSQAGKATRA